MAATSRGVTLLGPDKLAIREYPIPDIPSDGRLVKVEMARVCGSDVKYLHGGKAQLPYPLILGHEILGRVETFGKRATQIHGIKEGDRIILKSAKGCGRCAARFCKARTGYGVKPPVPIRPISTVAPPTIFTLFPIFSLRKSAQVCLPRPPCLSAR